jgi:hypothetical protein
VIGSSGQLLERSLVDCTVGHDERLCFEGPPVIDPPLKQDTIKRAPDVVDGQAVDTLTLGKLSEYEQHLARGAKAASAKNLSGTTAKIREQHDAALIKKIAGPNVPELAARRQVTARHRGVLLPDIELHFDDLEVATVAAVLAAPDMYIGETLADPVEGLDYGRCKAKVLRGANGALVIHTFAHGGALYHLRYDARSAAAALDSAPADGIVDHAMAVFATSELEPDELAAFAQAVARAADLPLAAVKARIAKEQRERQRSRRQAALAAER